MKYQTEDGKVFDNFVEAEDWESFIIWYSDNKLRTPQRHVVEPEAAYAWLREYNSGPGEEDGPLAEGFTERCAEGSEISDEFQYDWDKIDEEYQWAATDADGSVYGFVDKPSAGTNGVWGGEMFEYSKISKSRLPNPNWKESLRERP